MSKIVIVVDMPVPLSKLSAMMQPFEELWPDPNRVFETQHGDGVLIEVHTGDWLLKIDAP